MAHDAETRASARSLYVFQRQSLTAIAEALGLSVGTVRRWKSAAEADGDCWDRGRTAASMAGQGNADIVMLLVEDFVILHQAVIDGLKDAKDVPVMDKANALSKLADAFAKTMNAAGKASPEVNRLAVAQDVIQRLGRYIAEHFPEHGTAFLEVLEPFGKLLGKAYA